MERTGNAVRNITDVIVAGYNAVCQNGEKYKIVMGKGATLFLQHEVTSKIVSMEVGQIDNFLSTRSYGHSH